MFPLQNCQRKYSSPSELGLHVLLAYPPNFTVPALPGELYNSRDFYSCNEINPLHTFVSLISKSYAKLIQNSFLSSFITAIVYTNFVLRDVNSEFFFFQFFLPDTQILKISVFLSVLHYYDLVLELFMQILSFYPYKPINVNYHLFFNYFLLSRFHPFGQTSVPFGFGMSSSRHL
jgi:hypothetical protein